MEFLPSTLLFYCIMEFSRKWNLQFASLLRQPPPTQQNIHSDVTARRARTTRYGPCNWSWVGVTARMLRACIRLLNVRLLTTCSLRPVAGRVFQRIRLWRFTAAYGHVALLVPLIPFPPLNYPSSSTSLPVQLLSLLSVSAWSGP